MAGLVPAISLMDAEPVPNKSGSSGIAPSVRTGDDKKGSRSGDDQRGSARTFFGRRKGHPLRARQAVLFETLLPRLALDLTQPAPDDLRTIFPHPVEDVRLEIGFGGAEHLIAQAKSNPHIGFIGSDAFVNGVAKALAAIDEHQLDNIRLYVGDASRLLDWLPSATLARIDLLYPDPWPKRRHWKRRFIQDENLARLSRVLRPKSELRFATDIADYAIYALVRVMRSPHFIWTAGCADDWRKPWPDFSGTRYEAKAKREGRTPTYLTFRKV